MYWIALNKLLCSTYQPKWMIKRGPFGTVIYLLIFVTNYLLTSNLWILTEDRFWQQLQLVDVSLDVCDHLLANHEFIGLGGKLAFAPIQCLKFSSETLIETNQENWQTLADACTATYWWFWRWTASIDNLSATNKALVWVDNLFRCTNYLVFIIKSAHQLLIYWYGSWSQPVIIFLLRTFRRAVAYVKYKLAWETYIFCSLYFLPRFFVVLFSRLFQE